MNEILGVQKDSPELKTLALHTANSNLFLSQPQNDPPPLPARSKPQQKRD